MPLNAYFSSRGQARGKNLHSCGRIGRLATEPLLTLTQGRGIYTTYIPKWTQV